MTYNPIQEYFNHLPEWDGVDHIGGVANRVHTDADAQDLHNWLFRKWIVWTVAGWVNPNVSNQLANILVGKQNSFKTSFLRHLLPPEFRDLIGTLNLRGFLTGDDYLMLASNLFIELDEFDNLTPKELALFKSLMTMDKVGRRAAYARHSENRARIATFFGSTNNLNYLNDDSGNRRCFSV
jgi:predicted P-loop ATPase